MTKKQDPAGGNGGAGYAGILQTDEHAEPTPDPASLQALRLLIAQHRAAQDFLYLHERTRTERENRAVQLRDLFWTARRNGWPISNWSQYRPALVFDGGAT